MVDAQQVHKRGLEIMNVNRVFNDVVAERIGFPVREALFDARSGHPDGEAFRMMIASVIGFG